MATISENDIELLDRWDIPGPRYTSYPTALCFHDGFRETEYRAEVAQRRTEAGNEPLSLYVHLPFCEKLCFFCGCNKWVTLNREKIDRYVDDLLLEIAMEREIHGPRPVEQLHWGGGTPTWLDAEQRMRVMDALKAAFPFLPDGESEISIEADPRNLPEGTVTGLRELGFNRLSLGVQDFDLAVQEAVNRVQPAELSLRAIDEARAAGFHGVSVDLIYGLPKQTEASFRRTVEGVAQAAPDRISIFSYFHRPQMFSPQKCIEEGDLPTPEVKRMLFAAAVDVLTSHGYTALGMDHFVREGDDLLEAARAGTMHRNFQGYSTRADRDLVALGVTAIGRTDGAFWQKSKDLKEWAESVRAGRLPIARGLQLTDEDKLRREIIASVMCRLELVFDDFADRVPNFPKRFEKELALLKPMVDDKLLEIDEKGLRVKPLGRFVVKIIAGAFDEHTPPGLAKISGRQAT
ncbi:MAG TPA: oxygen-independent coproporphyrinogen III oxidase [Planctomycetes bacterium]|nr:oxygen-independent coproporphyrinogen III oxidase [Planctomycetota bacterium]